jgi:hypothetical protein
LEIITLPDDTKVFSGHGPASTIGDERQTARQCVRRQFLMRDIRRQGEHAARLADCDIPLQSRSGVVVEMQDDVQEGWVCSGMSA